MRPSKRQSVLDASLRVVERDGIGAVTLDAVAAEAGMSRGGLLYHFKSREALLEAIEQHLLDLWEAKLEEAGGAPADQLSQHQRLVAYVKVSTTAITSAEMALLLEFSKSGGRAWRSISDRWSVSQDDAASDDAAFKHFIVRLAADGLWAHDALDQNELDQDLRRRLGEHIVNMLGA